MHKGTKWRGRETEVDSGQEKPHESRMRLWDSSACTLPKTTQGYGSSHQPPLLGLNTSQLRSLRLLHIAAIVNTSPRSVLPSWKPESVLGVSP